MAFVFYDTETTGLRIGFDQIIQFAAIKTDNDLNEIDRFELRSRLQPHVVPHPKAMLTNGLPIEKLIDEGFSSHYRMVVEIRRRLLEWSPAIFVGYNSMGFDEEMLRHALFQTMHPAYLTNSHQNCRADAMGLALSTAALAPGVLRIPVKADGAPTYRLSDLALANDIAVGQSHDAIADAEATLGLCRHIKAGAPEEWQRFLRFSKKATVADFIEAEDGFVLTEFFGNQAYHFPVVNLGADLGVATRRLCLRLDVDLDALTQMSDVEMQLQLSQRPCPIRTVKVNAAPTLTELFEASDEMLRGVAFEIYEETARRIKADSELKSRLLSNYAATRVQVPAAEVAEQEIHTAFPTDQDDYRRKSFHNVPWPDALRLAQDMDHGGLRTFGIRLVYCEARSQMPEDLRRTVERELTDRLVEQTSYGFTLQQALEVADEMIAAGSDRGDILAGYRRYLVARQQKVTEYRQQLAVEQVFSADTPDLP